MLRTVPPRTAPPLKRRCRHVPARNSRDRHSSVLPHIEACNFEFCHSERSKQRAARGTSHWDAANCPTPNGTTSEALLPSSPGKKLPAQHTRTIPLPCSPNPVATSPLPPSESCPCLVAWPSQD